MAKNPIEEILNVLGQRDGLTTQRELSRITGFSRPTVKKYTEKLQESEQIEVTEIGNAYVYKLKNGGGQ